MSAVAIPTRKTVQSDALRNRVHRAPSSTGSGRVARRISVARPTTTKPCCAGEDAAVVDLATERQRRSRERASTAHELNASMRRHPAGQLLVGKQPATRLESLGADARSLPAATAGTDSWAQIVPLGIAMQESRGAVERSDLRKLVLRAFSWALATVFVLTAALGLGIALRPSPYSGQTWEHTVASGESLWGLAASLGSPRPLEDVVEDIRSLNGLNDVTLHVGQVVTLPGE